MMQSVTALRILRNHLQIPFCDLGVNYNSKIYRYEAQIRGGAH